MALKARQQPYIQPKQQEEVYQQVAPKKKRKTYGISIQEKMFLLVCSIVGIGLAVSIVHTQGQIQTTSMEIQKIESQTEEVLQKNADLKVEVSELSTYSRIWEKAKAQGLTLKEENVKVVPNE